MNKHGGHQTNFLSGEQKLPLPQHIWRLNCKLKNLALTISKFIFIS